MNIPLLSFSNPTPFADSNKNLRIVFSLHAIQAGYKTSQLCLKYVSMYRYFRGRFTSYPTHAKINIDRIGNKSTSEMPIHKIVFKTKLTRFVASLMPYACGQNMCSFVCDNMTRVTSRPEGQSWNVVSCWSGCTEEGSQVRYRVACAVKLHGLSGQFEN